MLEVILSCLSLRNLEFRNGIYLFLDSGGASSPRKIHITRRDLVRVRSDSKADFKDIPRLNQVSSLT